MPCESLNCRCISRDMTIRLSNYQCYFQLTALVYTDLVGSPRHRYLWMTLLLVQCRPGVWGQSSAPDTGQRRTSLHPWRLWTSVHTHIINHLCNSQNKGETKWRWQWCPCQWLGKRSEVMVTPYPLLALPQSPRYDCNLSPLLPWPQGMHACVSVSVCVYIHMCVSLLTLCGCKA